MKSSFAKTNIVELKNNIINEFTIDPKDLGINSNNKNNLLGKMIIPLKIIEIHKGASNEFSEAAALNAAGLIEVRSYNDLKEA